MNERIKKLAEQAGASMLHGGELSFFGNTSIEKFAELIVQECAMKLSRVPGGHDSSVFYKNSKILKEHFGVEE